MIKVLYKLTGNVFTLPDEEAMRIKKEDRDESYVFLDAGLQEEETATITEEEVKEIEEKQEQRVEEIEAEDKKLDESIATPTKKTSSRRKVYDVSDLEKLPKDDLVLLAEKLGIRDMDNQKREDIIKYITGEKKKKSQRAGKGNTRKI